jgi:acyl carrier protein
MEEPRLIDNESFVRIFEETLLVDRAEIVDDLGYQSIPEWDSVAQMALIAAFEQEYGITIDAEDIPSMTTVAQMKSILSRYCESRNN